MKTIFKIGGLFAVFFMAVSFFSQQAFAPPPGYPGFGPSPQVAIPAMAVNTPVLDLHKISVGTMANIVKAAVKGGHPRYVPLDGRRC